MRDFRAAFVSQGIASGGQFLVTLILVRWLGLSDFGVLAAVLILAGYGAGLVQAVCAQPFLSLPADGGLRRTSGILGLAISASGGVIAAALAHGLSASSYGLSAGLAGTLVAARSLVPLVRAYAHRDGRVGSLLAIDSIGAFGAAGLMAAQGPALGLAGAAAALAWASGLAALLGLVSGAPFRGHLSTGRAATDSAFTDSASTGAAIQSRASAKRLWKSGRWLALNQVFSWVGTGGVQGAALLQLGPSAVGALRLAQSVIGLGFAALQALDLALPKAAREAFERRDLGHWTRRVGVLALGAFGLFGAALAASSSWLVHGLLRPDAGLGMDGELAVLALQWLSFLPAVAALSGVLHVSFRVIEETRSIFVSYAASSVAAALCAGPLVQSFGVAGAAAGLLGGQGLFAAGLCILWHGRDKRATGRQDGFCQKLV